MNTDLNILAEQYRQNLFNTVNNAGLPPALVYYVTLDFFNVIDSNYKQYIKQAMQKNQEEQLPAENVGQDDSIDKE